MLARTLFKQIFLLKPSESSLSVLSTSYRAINTAARVTEYHVASLVRTMAWFCLIVDKGTEHACRCSSSHWSASWKWWTVQASMRRSPWPRSSCSGELREVCSTRFNGTWHQTWWHVSRSMDENERRASRAFFWSSSDNPAFFTERWTLLRSKFAKKKYWREYEIRTYYKKFHVRDSCWSRRISSGKCLFQYHHLTGSTADTFLEYIQRNLPEGIMMIVERVRISCWSTSQIDRSMTKNIDRGVRHGRISLRSFANVHHVLVSQSNV